MALNLTCVIGSTGFGLIKCLHLFRGIRSSSIKVCRGLYIGLLIESTGRRGIDDADLSSNSISSPLRLWCNYAQGQTRGYGRITRNEANIPNSRNGSKFCTSFSGYKNLACMLVFPLDIMDFSSNTLQMKSFFDTFSKNCFQRWPRDQLNLR